MLSLVSALAIGEHQAATDVHATHRATPYLGFDRNEYPGDANLAALHRTFAYTGYWLNNPPGAVHNSWAGKRKVVYSAGFGFLVLFNGRMFKQIQSFGDAKKLGTDDGDSAAQAAMREGFPPRTVIFLDQEEGGQLLPEQRNYLHAWVDAVTRAGFHAGVYCSGIAFRESSGTTVITAVDIHENAAGRKLLYWVANDACPPSPGCVYGKHVPQPADSGVPFADVWQFVQSPRRRDFAAHCSNYNADANCYAPGIDPAQHLHIDLNTATSPDPSGGRGRE